ncbi:hypothetical protein T265_00087 [Opisthorchis viverrini]|uniref:Uncharacterized protein n=1 Tax=Opisthorchis viverrini TaxID=6198 RepID=A0A075AJZ2_OPIVI|nr:hypothetical protein T265_00087 [Opisthorchis viverrini]KER34229.1 hypothetical protein T265_00087 [Opisthorchis viverrini]
MTLMGTQIADLRPPRPTEPADPVRGPAQPVAEFLHNDSPASKQEGSCVCQRVTTDCNRLEAERFEATSTTCVFGCG